MKSSGDPIGGTALPIIDAGVRPRRVIFIGVDAGRYDYLERFNVPNIERLISRGVSFRNAVCGSFMSETAPGFASLSTGVYAKTHGICTSRDWFDKETQALQYFYDDKTGKFRIEAPSLGEIWKRVAPNVKVAAVSTKDRPSLLMAGPEADTIVYCYNEKTAMRALGNPFQGRGVHDEYFAWTERTGRTVPSYLSDIRISRRIDWVADGVNRPDQEIADTPFIDRHIMDAALQVLDAEQPDLFFVTLVGVNIVAHLHGTNSPEIRAAVEEADAQIGRLLDRLEERGWLDDTLIVVASDHGMTDRPHQIDVLSHLAATPDVEANIAYYLSGACGGIYLRDNSTAAAERAIAAIRKIPNIRHVWRRDDPSAPWFVRRFAHRRCPDVLILADRLFQLVEKGWKKPSVSANHGPPYLSDINVWSIFSGAGVKPLGKMGKALDLMSEELLDEEREAAFPKQVDVHPTIRAICGF